jgi:hypothetical protein
VIPSVAGAPLAQTKGPEVERAQQASAASEHQVQGQQKAETAAGIGQADGDDHQTGERDADGRLPWNLRRRGRAGHPAVPAQRVGGSPAEPESPPSSKDPSGQSGSLLDLAG